MSVKIAMSKDSTWSKGYLPVHECVLQGVTYATLAAADELIEDAGLADEYDSTFPAENIPQVLATLRLHGYEVEE